VNLTLPACLQYCHLTLLRNRKDFNPYQRTAKDAVVALPSIPDDELLRTEALIDRQGYTTHLAAIIAGYIEKRDVGSDWDLEEPAMEAVGRAIPKEARNEHGRGPCCRRNGSSSFSWQIKS